MCLTIAAFSVITPAELSVIPAGPISMVEPPATSVMLAPDVIIEGRDYPGQARAEDNLNHPALTALTGTRAAGHLTDRDWICCTPQVLSAIRAMRDLRLSMEPAQ